MFFLLLGLAFANPYPHTTPMQPRLMASLDKLQLEFPKNGKDWEVYSLKSERYCSDITKYEERAAARFLAGDTNTWASESLRFYLVETLGSYHDNVFKYQQAQAGTDEQDPILFETEFESVALFMLERRRHTTTNMASIYPKEDDWLQKGMIPEVELAYSRVRCISFLNNAKQSVVHLNRVLGEAQVEVIGILKDLNVPKENVLLSTEKQSP